MKAKDTVATTILRLAQSEVAASELRAGKALSDDEAFSVIRKLVKSNEETLAASGGDRERVETLTRENQILTDLLPKGLSVDDLEALLGPARDAIRAAANHGQATGVAMKHLKSTGGAGSTNGNDVAAAVRRIRS
jgi:uncharacterized protein YqeY